MLTEREASSPSSGVSVVTLPSDLPLGDGGCTSSSGPVPLVSRGATLRSFEALKLRSPCIVCERGLRNMGEWPVPGDEVTA